MGVVDEAGWEESVDQVLVCAQEKDFALSIGPKHAFVYPVQHEQTTAEHTTAQASQHAGDKAPTPQSPNPAPSQTRGKQASSEDRVRVKGSIRGGGTREGKYLPAGHFPLGLLSVIGGTPLFK